MVRVSTWMLPVLGFGAGVVFVATCTDGSVPGLGDAGDAGVGQDGVVLNDGDETADAPADPGGDGAGGDDALEDVPSEEAGTGDAPPTDDGSETGMVDGEVVAEVSDDGGALDGFLDMNGADAAPDGDATPAGCPCAGQAEAIAELKERVEALEQRPAPPVAVNADGERLGPLVWAQWGEPGAQDGQFRFYDDASGRVYEFDPNSGALRPAGLTLVFESTDCTGEVLLGDEFLEALGSGGPKKGIGWNTNSGQAYALEDPGLTQTLQSGSFLTDEGECKTFADSEEVYEAIVTPSKAIEVGFHIPPKLPYAVE